MFAPGQDQVPPTGSPAECYQAGNLPSNQGMKKMRKKKWCFSSKLFKNFFFLLNKKYLDPLDLRVQNDNIQSGSELSGKLFSYCINFK